MSREPTLDKSTADTPPVTAVPSTALWERGFRPFFLLGAGYAFLVLPLWLVIYAGALPAPEWLPEVLWHGHELVFGVVLAAVAGFLLTAVPVWTATNAVSGAALAGLAALWTAGRLAMLAAGHLPAWLVAALDLAFLPALTVALARPLLSRQQRRNWGFVPILVALFAANLAMHAQRLGWTSASAVTGLHAAVELIIVIVVIVGGRIVPTFTRNAFARAGDSGVVNPRLQVGRLAVALVVGVAVVDLFVPRTVWSGAVALAAALALAWRMIGWRSLRTGRDPLLWSLHLGAAWIVVGFALVAVADLTGAVPWALGLHGLTAGAMGATILAVMTRVGLGHTGRPLVAPPGVRAMFVLVNAGALVRVVGPLVAPDFYLITVVVGGALWSLAFGLFIVVYASVLVRPRFDAVAGG